MFKKILIANRGEIACRVIRTARTMGIRTVAVYSDADARARHVAAADEAVRIGPPPAAESYLRIDAILAAAAETGSEAVHPGYGFLSENADFAEALDKAGIAFIGPPASAIRAMGDKIQSKKIAEEAGVNTIPGHADVVTTGKEAIRIARDIGYPVMLKASAGGGGKGMRIAWSDEEIKDGLVSARNEARSSFGDDRVFIEKYIVEPRHIEIQILCDAHGNAIHLGERECSIQRRHQKVIEEAPSPFIDETTRAAMGEQAIRLAQAVGYRSAGTVEFIVDRDRNFYFLEMNTRLQVEHPVTELVTDVDLVEEMLKIAAGEGLGISQENVAVNGWAVEARIYAEDPYRGFLPSTGRLTRYRPPYTGKLEDGAIVRNDTGVEEGADISIFYDPMIAKLCAHAQTRSEAVAHLRRALDEFHIRGISHNVPFLAAVLDHARFREGNLSTAFIDEEYPDGFAGAPLTDEVREVLIGVAAFLRRREAERAMAISQQLNAAKRLPAPDWVVQFGEESHPISIEPAENGYDVTLAGHVLAVRSNWHPGEPLFRGLVNTRPITVQIDHDTDGVILSHRGVTLVAYVRTTRAAELAGHMPERAVQDSSKYVVCPMPGVVISIAVEPGDQVKVGQPLAVIEAMKMENQLRAERDGVIAAVLVKPGDNLAVDEVILEFE